MNETTTIRTRPSTVTETRHEIDSWAGALGPQSDDEPLYCDLRAGPDSVELIGPLGVFYQYDRSEFEDLVEAGEWILASEDHTNELFRTTEGVVHY